MYNIKLVEKRVGIPSVTIRAWETRYGAVKPQRTESGHRLYSEQDIEDLLWLKLQTEEKGMSISQAAKQLHQRRERREHGEVELVVHQKTYQELVERLYSALCNFQTEQANAVLDFGLSMFQHDELFNHVLTEVMQRVGTEWDQGKRTIAQEHFVTQFVLQRLGQFFRIFPIDPSLPRTLSLCPSGEHHQVGLMMFSLFLRKKGLEVIYLGDNTPMQEVDEMIKSHRIQLICISATTKKVAEAVYPFVRELKLKTPRLKFVLGGGGFEDMPEDMKKWAIGTSLEDWRNWFSKEIMVF